jgi:hypothetical protein
VIDPIDGDHAGDVVEALPGLHNKTAPSRALEAK